MVLKPIQIQQRLDNKVVPNPYLSHVSGRDIETPSGKKLILMNPVYIFRQLMDDFDESNNIRGRITSMKPLNPVNASDEWGKKHYRHLKMGPGNFRKLWI